jgi:hypothetical protein
MLFEDAARSERPKRRDVADVRGQEEELDQHAAAQITQSREQ